MKGIILYYSIRAAEYFLVFKFLAVHRKKQTNARSQKKNKFQKIVNVKMKFTSFACFMPKVPQAFLLQRTSGENIICYFCLSEQPQLQLQPQPHTHTHMDDCSALLWEKRASVLCHADGFSLHIKLFYSTFLFNFFHFSIFFIQYIFFLSL